MYLYCPCEYVTDLEVLTGDVGPAAVCRPLPSTAAVPTRVDASSTPARVSEPQMESALDSQTEMVSIYYVSQALLILSSDK